MNSRSKFHYGYVIVFCCFLIMCINVGIALSSAGIFYKPVSLELGVSFKAFGLYMTFNYLAATLMLSVAGKLMDKYSARWLLTISSILLAVVYIAMSLFTSLWQFYIAGILIGISFSFLLYLSYPTMINRWFNSKVSFFIGISSSASGFGGIIFSPLGGYLITHYGWRATYLIFGLIILIVVTPLLGILLRDYPRNKGLKPYENSKDQKNMGEVSLDKTGISYKEAIKTPYFYALLIFTFLIFSLSTLNLYLPTYITFSGYTVEQSAMVVAWVMIAVSIGKVILGWINDKNIKIGLITAVSLGSIGLILLIFGKSHIFIMNLGGFFYGWVYAGISVICAYIVRYVFGNKDYAKIYANISIAMSLGGIITSALWGEIAQNYGFYFTFIVGICFIITAGILGFYVISGRKKLRTLNHE